MRNEELIKEIDKQKETNRNIRYPRRGYMMSLECNEALRKNNVLLDRAQSALRIADKEYERGCNDAWELARKISMRSIDGGYTRDELLEIFGYLSTTDVFRFYKAYSEARREVRDYEKKKEEAKLKPGDVVEYELCGEIEKAIFLYESDDYYWVIKELGACPQKLGKLDFTLSKTYKHVNLEGLFEELKEG